MRKVFEVFTSWGKYLQMNVGKWIEEDKSSWFKKKIIFLPKMIWKLKILDEV